MMSEVEIILKTSDLLIAIEQNDLEQTKKLVEYLNINFQPSLLIPSLNGFLPFDSIFNKGINNSFIYLLDNLIYLDERHITKWNIEVRELRKKGSKKDIENFIMQFLNTEDKIPNYKLISLIQLSTLINRTDLLAEINKKNNIIME